MSESQPPSNSDPNLHWDGTKWLRWNGSQWTDAASGVPIQGDAASTQPAPVPPPGSVAKKSGAGKGCLIAVAVAVGLVVILGIVIAATGGGESGSTGSDSTPSAVTSEPGNDTGAAQDGDTNTATGGSQIGQSVRDGDFEFVVTKAESAGSVLGNQQYLKETAQGEWFVVTMKVTNIGNEAQMLDAGDQKAFNASNQEFSASMQGSLAANNHKTTTFLNNINPGNSVSGKIAFDVPKGTDITRLELHDSILSGGVSLQLK